MPETVLTVFISSTAADLQQHRNAVYERLRPISFLKVRRMEDFGAPNADGVKACRDGVLRTDLFVALIGMRRGWEPDDDARSRSITEMEYDWAKEADASRFVHVSPDEFPVPGNLYESSDKHERQSALRRRIMGEHIVARGGFESSALLASTVVENLLTQIIRDPRLVDAIQSSHASATADINAARLLNTDRATGVIHHAANAGVDRVVIFELARRLKPNEIDNVDQAMKELAAAVEVAIEVAKQGRRGNLDDLVNDTLKTIAEKTKTGDLDGAARAAEDGFARWQKNEEMHHRDETERRERSLQNGVRLLQAGLEQDILRRDAAAAAAKVATMVELEFADLPDKSHRFEVFRKRQDEFDQRGRDQGINFDLQVAIEISRRMLSIAKTSDERATVYNDLSVALQNLGERDSDNTYLEEAIDACHHALLERPRERVPLQWAMTQNNLGTALKSLGSRTDDTARLEQAVEAFRNALLERTRERTPLDWASTQSNLGGALRSLGELHSNNAWLEEAITAYRNALLERPRKRFPRIWAMIQTNLGIALETLGKREDNIHHLKEAVRAHRNALKELTLDSAPLDWAMTQNNLGVALHSLGEHEGDTDQLKDSVETFLAALKVLKSARANYYVEGTLKNLNHAQASLAKRRPS